MIPRFIAFVAIVEMWIAAAIALPAEPVTSPTEIRTAINKSLPLLMAGATGHRENRTCFACHQQGPPIFALMAARERGFKIDDEEINRQTTFIAKFLEGNRENYLQGKGQGGQADTAGYALWTLSVVGYKSDSTTSAVAEYFLQRHKDKDHWLNSSNRPPSEASPFSTTYLALYGLDTFGTAEQAERIESRKKQVREWLLNTPAGDNEDRVFRLWALEAAGAERADVEAATKELLAKQREDGGWAQLNSGDGAYAESSDGYATGSALVALNQAGDVAASDPVFQNGLAYLLKNQLDDGSWRITSRSKPFQPYYESGFPHGKDQFISCAATGWATWALVLAIDR